MITSKDPVQIYLKIKPISAECQKQGPVFQTIDDVSISFENKLYKFDSIIKDTTSCSDFFENCLRPACDSLLLGTSTTVFLYGQTGSGKTFTLFGDSKESGTVRQVCEYILNSVSNVTLKFSVTEIYQEQVYDLLAPTVKGLNLKEDLKAKVSVEGLWEENIFCMNDFDEVVTQIGKKTGGIKSHLIYTLGLNNQKLVFVDLAGTKRSKNSSMSSDKFKENSGVNKSLTVLANVMRALRQKSDYINFRNSKLTFFLKDHLLNSSLIVIATVIPLKKYCWETSNTIKFAQNAINVNEDPEIETIDYLQNEIQSLRQELEFSKENIKNLSLIHENCERKFVDLEEKVCLLEEENKILRKEIVDLTKIENSDWLLSSDSDDQETIQNLIKEKKDLEFEIVEKNKALGEMQQKFEAQLQTKTKEIEQVKKELENYTEELKKATEDANKRCATYQELSVLLSKQNSDLIAELSKSKENIYEYIADFSNISSTDSSKCEIYKIIEEKDAKVTNLLENSRNAEENYQKLKEKYIADVALYKKQVSRLKAELATSKAENIKENAEAMHVLEELRQEKAKLLSMISGSHDSYDRKKVQELKEMNAVLLENLKIKGQQIADLHKQFENFLNDKGYSPDLIQKLNNKTQKNKNFQNEFFKIKAFLLRFSKYRHKIENLTISDCVIDIISNFHARNAKNSLVEDKLNFTNS